MGYVGSVTAAALAREGHRVVGIDANQAKVEMLQHGQSPVLEQDLPELVRRVVAVGTLTATTSAVEALATAEVIIICVGTPSAHTGALDSRSIERVAEEVGSGIRSRAGYAVVVVRSTVTPELLEGVILPVLERTSGKRAGAGFGLVVNPEFLREGTALKDFDAPQFTLIGTAEPRSTAIVRRLYGFLKAPVVVTDRRTASLVKYASNAFHAMKVAFANEVAAVSAAMGADGAEVMRLFCLDGKLNLSEAYLKPGMPFGGSCLPKDLRALLYSGRHHDLTLPLFNAVLHSNRLQTDACIERILAQGRTRVGICGMAFKAGTDDLRESPMVTIVEALLGKGLQVAIYDRRVSMAHLVGANREYVERHVPHIANLIRPTLDETVAGAEVVVIGNADEEFRRVEELIRPDQVLIDLVGTTVARADSVDRIYGAGI
jgi:GDP-mannose 6-dehydrogenase